ncbi:LuxR family transcriptional regulator [Tardiphaga alba]|uniref:LuxR family transcriptional regulator n=2 Tax=Tardiphaga alba TaxID=340268 RepID=A0ABX8AIZ4_9BRAD|nr:LuxR family transcriptional regulator [Tardiphaga alba]
MSPELGDSSQDLSDLIGCVYDTVLDSSSWTGVIEKAMQFVGGIGASLYTKNAALPSGHAHHVIGIAQEYQDSYFSKYVAFDPTTTGQFFAEVDEPIGIEDVLPFSDFTETRFYREWAQPQGLVDCLSTVLDKSVTNVAMFGVFRHVRDGVADDAARHRLRLLAPHIRRAVMIGRIFDLKTSEAATLADTLDGLSVGLFLVSSQGRIVHANAAGHALLDSADILRAVSGRLVAADGQADRTLRDAYAAAAQGDEALGTRGIAVPLMGQDETRYLAHLLPLTSGARRDAGLTRSAAAALFVRKAELSVASPPEVISKAFKLTPSELRVLLAIVEVGGVPDVAAALGVAETTIKTHLGRLFEKTGATRQADLVKLFAGYSTPLIA